jgi:hypothetical protein
MPAVERIFERDSDAALALLARDDDAEELAVLRVDELAAGLGLDLDARLALAASLRAAHEPYPPEAAADYRARARRLRERLAAARPAALPRVPRRLAPVLVHLAVNRMLGTDADQEARVVYLWQRTLEGLRATGAGA